MQYVHVKNIEKYHPGYRDRKLSWCKLYFASLNSDPEFCILDEVSQWRFFKFVMLELQMQKQVPLDDKFLQMKGFDTKKYPISLTLKMLHKFIDVCNESVTVPLPREEKEEEKEEEKSRVEAYVTLERSTLAFWNEFCSKYPLLSKVKEISGKRREKLKKRFEKDSFKNFQPILEAIEKQRFLFGENDRKWRVSLDWLIENDTNYLKVLELKYMNHETESDLVKLKEKYRL